MATSNEILVARTEFLVALMTRKGQFRTLPTIISLKNQIKVLSNREKDQKFSINILMKSHLSGKDRGMTAAFVGY